MKYEREHAECLEWAWSLCKDRKVLRAMVTDCLMKKGYQVLGPGELEPFLRGQLNGGAKRKEITFLFYDLNLTRHD